MDKVNPERKATEVVAALIWHGDKFLICQRPEDKARALLWEFVGGKVEPGETKEQALVRECKEELDITVSVGDLFMDAVHEYTDITVHLSVFNSAIEAGAGTTTTYGSRHRLCQPCRYAVDRSSRRDAEGGTPLRPEQG